MTTTDNRLATLRAALFKPKFCSRCGRTLVEEIKPSKGFDRKTGKPNPPGHWLTCPRHPRNALAYLLRGNHDCVSVEFPLIQRQWR